MSAYADASFLASLYLPDIHSSTALEQMKASELPVLLSPLGSLELANAISLRINRKELRASEAERIHDSFQEDVTAGVFLWKPVRSEAFDRAVQIARVRTPHVGTRALDVLHVACALDLGAEIFHTFDQKQRILAEAEGLVVP